MLHTLQFSCKLADKINLDSKKGGKLGDCFKNSWQQHVSKNTKHKNMWQQNADKVNGIKVI